MSQALPLAGPDILRDPAALLFRVDLGRGVAHFLEVTARTFIDSTWLDYRLVQHTGRQWQLPLAELGAVRIPAPPTAWLFHTAFCCSTLLARALQALPGTHVLREPLALRDLADARRAAGSAAAGVAPLIGPVLDQLSKRPDPRAMVVIKPTNLADNLVPDLLTARPAAPGLVLSSGFESWVVSCLKKSAATQARFVELARAFGATDAEFVAAGGLATPLQQLEAMVLTWMLQRRAWTRRLLADGGRRLRALDAEQLLAQPVAVLGAVAVQLGIAATPAELVAVVDGPVWQRNAKDPALAFAAGQRATETRLIAQMYGPELRAAAACRDHWEALLPTAPVLPAALML
jgi:hypothetical protein